MPSYNNVPYEWKLDLAEAGWDRYLMELNGHPLQSALWGDARQEIDNIQQSRWAVFESGRPVWMARVEERNLSIMGKIAWIPRGPTRTETVYAQRIQAEFTELLRRDGYILVVSDPWEQFLPGADKVNPGRKYPQTIWIDLGVGKDALWKNLDKQWRYGVNRARKSSVVVENTCKPEDITRFYELCVQTSEEKKFKLPASIQLMRKLLECEHHEYIEARLLVARIDNIIAAGILVIRCGMNLHYFWGATDRNYSEYRVSEALQWHAIEWALENKCKCYDLEGIDPDANPGVYQFKKKMGGKEIVLTGKQVVPVTWTGQITSLFIK